MRWLLVILTGLALLLSACGKIGGREKIAVVNWDKVLTEHPQYARLQQLKEEYSLLLDRRREQEIISRTKMSSLAKLYQLKQNSKQSFLSADFYTRMAERQSLEQEQLKKLSLKMADDIDKELAGEEAKMSDHYRLQIFNLRLKLDTIRMMPEERKKLEAELQKVQEAREQDRMLFARHKMALMNQRMKPHLDAMRNRLDNYARQLQAEMRNSMLKDGDKDASALQKAPAALKALLETVDGELDKQQEGIETLETSLKKDMESAVIKLVKERNYSVVFYKYRMNISADDITDDVIAVLKRQAAFSKAADALSKKSAGPAAK